MPPNPKAPGGEMEVDRAGQPSGDGLRSYYITKIEELLLTVNDKRQNVRRLQVRISLLLFKVTLANNSVFASKILYSLTIYKFNSQLTTMPSGTNNLINCNLIIT